MDIIVYIILLSLLYVSSKKSINISKVFILYIVMFTIYLVFYKKVDNCWGGICLSWWGRDYYFSYIKLFILSIVYIFIYLSLKFDYIFKNKISSKILIKSLYIFRFLIVLILPILIYFTLFLTAYIN